MSAMYLYSLTLQRATAITHAIYGNFSAPKAQEIVVARGKILELLRPTESGKVQTVLSMDVFGIVRSLMPFRLTGDTRDYIVVGSDSGRIVILQYNPDKNAFDKIHQETFGKSGCRRIVPGQWLACDPKGRAVMIGAVEKQKLVYILNRDSAARLTISSPLEAHKSHTIIFSITGVDVNFDNPIFAAIELDYADADQDPTGVAAANAQKHLTFYELDLGLNHVVRKWSEPIDNGASKLLTVPGGADGPGGVLICCENMVIWKNQGHEEVRAYLPRRKEWPRERSLLIVSAASHKQKDLFFFLLQSECGDLYKATLKWKDDTVYEIQMNYFDTVPVSNSMCVLKTGFLFVASEFSNHFLYQFQSIGDNDAQESDMVDEGVITFSPQPLKNLTPIYEMESLSPIVDFKALDLLKEDAKQLYVLCGRGPRSSLRVLRHGLAVTEMAVSTLPGNPNSVWTVKRTKKDEFDRYIIVSFVNATLVLSIGDTVEEVTDSGFLGSTTTLNVGLIGDDALVQIYPNGIRFIRSDRRITEWPTPGKKSIVHSAINRRQVIIALSGGELLYFELDVTGQLSEVCRKEMGRDIACLGVAPIPKGRQRARFLAVGDYDNTVRICSLDPGDNFGSLAVLALPAPPESLCILKMRGHSASDPSAATLYLNIGLQNGVLMRTVLDRITGELTDTRTRFLGSRPVRLFRTRIQGEPGMLALSSRPWLCYNHQQRFQLTPLSYPALEYASNFSSEQCPEGIVATTANTLRIITPERLGDVFNQEEIKLRYTPRKMLVHPTTNYIITIETDHNAYPATISGGLRGKILEAQQGVASSTPEIKKEKMDVDDEGKEKEKEKGKEELVKELEHKQREQANREEYERMFGAPKPGKGQWASCIRIFDAISKETIDICELDNNEAAFCACTCVFHDRGGEVFLVVGTAKDMQLHPRSDSGGFIHVYRLLDNGKRFSLLHKTPVEMVPTALAGFQGRLLVGLGKMLRIYDLGKKKLLRKCENKNFPSMIRNIALQGDRIIISDLAESFHFVKYRKSENQLLIFADDFLPRWLTAQQVLDYDTVAGADKFGNVFILRVPAEANDEVEDPAGPMFGRGYLNGAPYKLQTLANVHIGEIVNSLSKTSLVGGGAEALIYTTIMGGLGAILPFVSREDVDFFSHLEMHMRSEMPPLCGRDHLSFRSYYFPVKDVIDGDLCEQYAMLPPDKQRQIAEELDRTPSEVLKKLEVIRNSLL